MTLEIQVQQTQQSSFNIEAESLETQVQKGLYFILSHFEAPRWPRKISTYSTGGKQILVYNRQETLSQFKQADDYLDCRINAYPAYIEYNGINRQAPNFIFIDIDKSNFKTGKAYNSAVSKTLKNFKEKLPNAFPTILDTGNGCHFYQPIQAFVLEQEEIFTKLHSEPSKSFLKFAEQFLSNNKADHSHNPTFKSCMLRVPGSINSKCSKTVKIIQKWDGYRPAINYLLRDFREYLIQMKIDQHLQSQKLAKKYSSFSAGNNTVSWIESNILQGSGISDFRKITIDLILAPYLVNVKKCDYGTAYNTIANWLDKCGKIRPLDFKPRYKINYALKRANNGPVLYPMKHETIKSNYPQMYQEIFLYEQPAFE